MADLTAHEKELLVKLLEEKEKIRRYNKANYYLPDEGPLRRELYPRHTAFFAAGATYPQRLFMAGNRTGKSDGGGAEASYHLTGLYPYWWEGKRFNHPIEMWASSKTGVKTRDTCQYKLLGHKSDMGTGFIPKHLILDTKAKPGIPDGVESALIRHVSGGTSWVGFLSNDAGVDAYTGTAKHVIWLDEEHDYNVYAECVIRTMTVKGIVYMTFTPDHGLSETVLQFFKDGLVIDGGQGYRHVTTCDMDDCPHLGEDEKKQFLSVVPEWQRTAKKSGIPTAGVGAIYPVPEDAFVVKPIDLPDFWPRVYGLDVGWNRTAAMWAAWDRDTDTLYVYSEHYRGQAEPSVHADAIKARGAWIYGIIDKGARGRSATDGAQLITMYGNLGLKLLETKGKSPESGIQIVLQRLSAGRLKVFNTCQNFIKEFRLYRRDDKGAIVKTNDHLLDALRYLVTEGLHLARTETEANLDRAAFQDSYYAESGRSPIGGY